MKNYKLCSNKDKDWYILWSACADCYYYKERDLICPNCKRSMPNNNFRKNEGCKWCQK